MIYVLDELECNVAVICYITQTCERVSGSEHSATDLCESISVRPEDGYLGVDVAG